MPNNEFKKYGRRNKDFLQLSQDEIFSLLYFPPNSVNLKTHSELFLLSFVL
jgi:hypothetical protein